MWETVKTVEFWPTYCMEAYRISQKIIKIQIILTFYDSFVYCMIYCYLVGSRGNMSWIVSFLCEYFEYLWVTLEKVHRLILDEGK